MQAFGALAKRLSASERRIAFGFLDDLSLSGKYEEAALADAIAAIEISPSPFAKLYELRYPELSSMERIFSDFVRSHLARSGVHLEAPPHFEGEAFSIHFEFTSRDVLKNRIAKLAAVEKDCDDLFRLLR